jgi:cobalt-zinc-cadmium resistance protein CzcA
VYSFIELIKKMLDKIIAFSIKNKFIIALMTLALIVWGVWSATKLPIDAVPDITNNQVQIITVCPTLAGQEVEQLVTYPIAKYFPFRTFGNYRCI